MLPFGLLCSLLLFCFFAFVFCSVLPSCLLCLFSFVRIYTVCTIQFDVNFALGIWMLSLYATANGVPWYNAALVGQLRQDICIISAGYVRSGFHVLVCLFFVRCFILSALFSSSSSSFSVSFFLCFRSRPSFLFSLTCADQTSP